MFYVTEVLNGGVVFLVIGDGSYEISWDYSDDVADYFLVSVR